MSGQSYPERNRGTLIEKNSHSSWCHRASSRVIEYETYLFFAYARKAIHEIGDIRTVLKIVK